MHPLMFIRTEIFELSQAELAAGTGLAQQSISRWERGEAEIDCASMGKIRDFARQQKIKWDDAWFWSTPRGKAA